MSGGLKILTGFMYLCITLIVILAVLTIYSTDEDNYNIQEGVEATIVDKYTDSRSIIINRVFTRSRSYHLIVEFDDGARQSMACTSSEYNSVIEGDSLLFDLFLDKETNELIKLDFH